VKAARLTAMTEGRKAGFWHDIARQVEKEALSDERIEKMIVALNTIWFGRVGQIIAVAVFVMVIAWSSFWGGVYYRGLQELEVSIGDRTYQACLGEARTSAELSGAANMIEEPCRRQQVMVQAKVVSIFREYVWQEPLDNLIKGTFIWFSLCVIAAAIRFFVREARVVLASLVADYLLF